MDSVNAFGYVFFSATYFGFQMFKRVSKLNATVKGTVVKLDYFINHTKASPGLFCQQFAKYRGLVVLYMIPCILVYN
jgi:hypothetical protein